MFILSGLKLNVVVSLGEYINAVASRIVIGTLDLKQFLPKFKYFCWCQQGLYTLPPLSTTVSISKPPPPSAADVICERSLTAPWDRALSTCNYCNKQDPEFALMSNISITMLRDVTNNVARRATTDLRGCINFHCSLGGQRLVPTTSIAL